GGLISAPGQVHQLHHFQWRYMPGDLFKEWMASLKRLQSISFDLLCPSHGEAMANGAEGIDLLLSRASKLEQMMNPSRLYVPDIPLTRILPHLIHVDRTSYLILSENGHGIMIDYGYVDDQLLERLKAEYGLKQIDVMIYTHYHDDHVARGAEVQY